MGMRPIPFRKSEDPLLNPSTYTEEYCESRLREYPRAVDRLLIGAFINQWDRNKLSKQGKRKRARAATT